MAFDFPASPTAGQQFTPISGGPTYVWQSPVWRLASGGVNAGVWIGDNPPLAPVQGMLWYESDSGNSFIWYDDGSSAQWVQFNLAAPLPVLVPVTTTISVSGTYTKPAGLKLLEVTCIGGGGGGIDIPATAAGQSSVTSGGGGGGTTVKTYAADEVPATVPMTVGAGGGLSASGGTTSFLSQTAIGGTPAQALGAGTTWVATGGGGGGGGAGFDIRQLGGPGGWCIRCPGGASIPSITAGGGGGSFTAPTQADRVYSATLAPVSGGLIGFGVGCSGGGNIGAAAAQPGGGGANGAIILKEFF